MPYGGSSPSDRVSSAATRKLRVLPAPSSRCLGFRIHLAVRNGGHGELDRSTRLVAIACRFRAIPQFMTEVRGVVSVQHGGAASGRLSRTVQGVVCCPHDAAGRAVGGQRRRGSRKPKVAAVCDDGAPLNCPVVGLKAYCLSAPMGATYRLFCQNTGVAKMPFTTLTVCSTLFVAPLNLPRLSRFSRKRLPCFPPPITNGLRARSADRPV